MPFIKKHGIAITRVNGIISSNRFTFNVEVSQQEYDDYQIKMSTDPIKLNSDCNATKLAKIAKVEESFKQFCITNKVKYKSKTYYKYQLIYFNGAIPLLGEIPPKWGICLMSSREIIEDYTIKSIINNK